MYKFTGLRTMQTTHERRFPTMFTVFYHKRRNPFITHCQASDGRTGSRAFQTLQEALDFARTVPNPRVYSPVGRKVVMPL